MPQNAERSIRPRRRGVIRSGLLAFLTALAVPAAAQQGEQEARLIVPLDQYVSIKPTPGGHTQKNALTISVSEIRKLTVAFERANLPREGGPQFLKIKTTIFDQNAVPLDNITQFAFTFPPEDTPEEDNRQMEDYARQILQFGLISRGRSDSVQVRLDTIPAWGYLRIEVVPDEEYTKYISGNEVRMVWHYRIRGHWLDSKFTLGIPKVIYDTRATDTVDYGNASALLRFFYINQVTGTQFPVSLGFGLYGVSTPIDVSKRGGGVVFSLYFDIIQFLRVNGVEITDKANAGLEIAPFIPVDRKARVLLSARIGYTP